MEVNILVIVNWLHGYIGFIALPGWGQHRKWLGLTLCLENRLDRGPITLGRASAASSSSHLSTLRWKDSVFFPLVSSFFLSFFLYLQNENETQMVRKLLCYILCRRLLSFWSVRRTNNKIVLKFLSAECHIIKVFGDNEAAAAAASQKPS